MSKAWSVTELMKDTPLLALRGREKTPPRARLWGKLELALPGQMKDRVALSILEDAERNGSLRPGGLVIESSSGTMAEGLARVTASKGYRLIIVTDPRIDAGLLAKLHALGAEVEVVDSYSPVGGWQRSRLLRLKELLDRHPDAFWPRQYDNPSNPAAYSRVLARELLADLGEGLTALVASVGSGGSLCGTARALRAALPHLRTVAVDATGSVQFHQPDRRRLQSGHGNSLVAGNIDYGVIDEVHWLNDGEVFNACRELARREGVFAGGSSGAAYVVGSWLAQQLPAGTDVVCLFPDRGDRYATTIYSDDYLREHGLEGVEAPSGPREIRYGVDVAGGWSRAPLPEEGRMPYYAAEVPTSWSLSQEIGLPC